MDLSNVKQQIQEVIDRGIKTSNSLSSIKKQRPELWNEMVKLTSFLPITASSPQRAWHVMNDVVEIPRCLVTNKETKWISYGVGYTKTIDRSSKTRQQHQRGDFDNSYNEEINKKRSDSNKKAHTSGLRKPHTLTKEIIDARGKKAKETCLKRYGVDNYWKSAEFKSWQKSFLDEKFKETREQRTEKEKYYHDVYQYTEKNWYEHFYRINPTMLQRGNDIHLDHIYSIAQGFIDGIDPEIIGHWTNLRMLSKVDNSSKGPKCGKTKEELLEDFRAKG